MQPVNRQLEAALADVEGSSKSGIFNAIRKYLQLVRAFIAPPIAAEGQQEASLVLIDVILSVGARAQGQGVRKRSPPGIQAAETVQEQAADGRMWAALACTLLAMTHCASSCHILAREGCFANPCSDPVNSH